jgi:hypothetical protein
LSIIVALAVDAYLPQETAYSITPNESCDTADVVVKVIPVESIVTFVKILDFDKIV